MRTFTDRTAVVTGAASGIGRATALALADAGCNLALVDIDAASLGALAEGIAARGRTVSTHVVDVSDRESVVALPDRVLAAHGAVHVLVNNAGVTVAKGFNEHTLDDFEWVMGVNLWGVVYGCHAFLPHLMRAPEAHIVNISSIFGVIGVPAQTSYCASKFAVRGFTEALWEELEGTHIGVTCVHPGGIATNIMANARADDPALKARVVDFFAREAIPPEVAAARIVAGIRANRRRVLITREAYVFDALKRLLPVLGNTLGVRALTRVMGLDTAVDEGRQRALAAARGDAGANKRVG